MVSKRQLAEIVMLRGLGYTQKEIAGKTSLTQSAIQYHLSEINDDARQRGETETFISILTDGFLPEVMEKIRMIEKIV